MIKKDEENKGKKVQSFKKFSDMDKGSKIKNSDEKSAEETILPDDNDDIPGFQNLPKNNTKKIQDASTRYMKPDPKNQDYDRGDHTAFETEAENDEGEGGITNSIKKNENNKVKFYGKVAKLPKGVKAAKGYNFLESVKISKSSIWYLMVERQDNELQMVKYNYKKGVDLAKFVSELKTFYISKYKSSPKIKKMIESIEIGGNDKYSLIRNIPLIEIEGKKMITIITADLIKLLSK